MADPQGVPTRPAVLALDGTIVREAVPDLCAQLRALLAADHATTVVLDLAGVADPDLATVEAVARLQLTAKRAGASVQLRNACAWLRAQLRFVGLDAVVPCEEAGPSAVESGRQPEVGEQGVDGEEVVQPNDPSL